ncbi:MAG TPA: hypothetical protein DHW63_02800 [Hyphomonadaceae bacterium]|nr:hypothetical protein [Hyphomonadaceae bacterium]
MKHAFILAAIEGARLGCLLLATLLLPLPQSNSNETIVYKDVVPVGAFGLIGAFALTAYIGKFAPRYGLASAAILGILCSYGIYLVLDYWQVLR